MKCICAIVAAAFTLAPQVAAAQQDPVRPVLSTTMQRVCQSEATSMVVVRAGQTVTDPMPMIQRQERRLIVRELGTGLAFEHITHSPFGTVRYHVTTEADGSVKSADIEGMPGEIGLSEKQLGELARNSADDLPERLLLGRAFTLGESYYPDPLRRDLIGRMTEAVGMPFPVTGSLDVFFRGEVAHGDRRAWLFDGTLTIGGSGPVDGVVLGLRQTGTARVLHDVETGLVLTYEVQMQNHFDVDEKPFGVVKSSDRWQCEIVPQ